jgi:hypothetical protein
MNIITAIFDIITVLQRGDGAFCRSSTVIKLAAKISSASLLAIIGVNLVLVFVINIKGTKRLECILYTSVFLYVMVTISVPIHEITTSTLEPNGPYQCWYYIHFYELFGHSDFLWVNYWGGVLLSAGITVLIVMYSCLYNNINVIFVDVVLWIFICVDYCSILLLDNYTN